MSEYLSRFFLSYTSQCHVEAALHNMCKGQATIMFFCSYQDVCSC